MKPMVDMELIIDEQYTDPKITIHTNAKTEQVERMMEAIENTSQTGCPFVSAYSGGKLELISQRDIMRIRTEGRQIVLDTEDKYYIIKQTLSHLEQALNADRFIRISQSEIINIYKVKYLDISVAGTIQIEFDNGVKTYVSRRHIKALKRFLREREGACNK